jgi:ABC-type polysaccharide/polyol phosphate transport system ATPase subunit
MTAVSFRNVTKTFPRHSGQQLMKQHLQRFFARGRSTAAPFYALRDISFTVPAGEGLAVIGSNGAGKSTLLGLTAGLARPTSGEIEVNGRIAALLELGAGFHPDLTGAENVRLYASLMGLSERQTREHFDSIVEFSGVRDFIGEPLRTYSSGMIVRLAFSVAVNLDPDILIIDEVLAVGDAAFRAKCLERILGLRRAGKTFICVSHSKEMLADICDQAIWLEHGQAMLTGPLDEVFRAYTDRLAVTA